MTNLLLDSKGGRGVSVSGTPAKGSPTMAVASGAAQATQYASGQKRAASKVVAPLVGDSSMINDVW